MANHDDPGPLVPLSSFWRITLALTAVAIALLHLYFPDLAIDALFIGLLVAGGALVFFDVDSFEFGGLKARRQRQHLEEVQEEVAEVDVPDTAPVALTPPSPEEHPFQGGATLGYSGIVHRPAAELTPPVLPLERLLWGYEQIRIELIVLAGSGGQLPDRRSWEDYQAPALASLLASKDMIPSGLVTPIHEVTQIRNELVHGGSQASLGVLRAAGDLAMETLAKLRGVKRHYVRVLNPHVVVYRDQSLSALIQDLAGVMIAQVEDDGTVSAIEVYPRGMPYVRGRFVSWEWDMEKVAKVEAWYEDSQSRSAKMAWSSSATFVGREYPTQWGLEYRLPHLDVTRD